MCINCDPHNPAYRQQGMSTPTGSQNSPYGIWQNGYFAGPPAEQSNPYAAHGYLGRLQSFYTGIPAFSSPQRASITTGHPDNAHHERVLGAALWCMHPGITEVNTTLLSTERAALLHDGKSAADEATLRAAKDFPQTMHSRQVPAPGRKGVAEGIASSKNEIRRATKVVSANSEKQGPTPLVSRSTQTDPTPPATRVSPMSTQTALPQPTATRRVRWAPAARVRVLPLSPIIRASAQPTVFTVPFTVDLVICGRNYMIDFTPVEAGHASLRAVEIQLVRVVAQEHKETLHAFLKYNEYSLRFERLSRKSSFVIPLDHQMSRETAYKTFLNAVFRGAYVRLR